jgi:hypothetical protein
MKTNAHVETGYDMIKLDQSDLGSCHEKYRSKETTGRTVVFTKVSRILPVDHFVIRTPREGGRAIGRQRSVCQPYKAAQGRSMAVLVCQFTYSSHQEASCS